MDSLTEKFFLLFICFSTWQCAPKQKENELKNLIVQDSTQDFIITTEKSATKNNITLLKCKNTTSSFEDCDPTDPIIKLDLQKFLQVWDQNLSDVITTTIDFLNLQNKSPTEIVRANKLLVALNIETSIQEIEKNLNAREIRFAKMKTKRNWTKHLAAGFYPLTSKNKKSIKSLVSAYQTEQNVNSFEGKIEKSLTLRKVYESIADLTKNAILADDNLTINLSLRKNMDLDKIVDKLRDDLVEDGEISVGEIIKRSAMLAYQILVEANMRDKDERTLVWESNAITEANSKIEYRLEEDFEKSWEKYRELYPSNTYLKIRINCWFSAIEIKEEQCSPEYYQFLQSHLDDLDSFDSPVNHLYSFNSLEDIEKINPMEVCRDYIDKAKVDSTQVFGNCQEKTWNRGYWTTPFLLKSLSSGQIYKVRRCYDKSKDDIHKRYKRAGLKRKHQC